MDKHIAVLEELRAYYMRYSDEKEPQIQALDAAIALMRGQSWQDIATYPDDSLPRLFLCRGRVVQGFKDVTGTFHVQHELGWRQMRRAPSHWQQLLPYPEKKDSADEQ